MRRTAEGSRVAPIIGSVIGIGRYRDILTVSVIGISIVLLTDYASRRNNTGARDICK